MLILVVGLQPFKLIKAFLAILSHLKSLLSKAMFVSRNSLSGKPLSKLSCVCLPLEKLVNRKHFPIKEKFGLVFKKVLSFYFERKTLSENFEKFRNVILFAELILH